MEGEQYMRSPTRLPFHIAHASELQPWCAEQGNSISEIVLRNELSWRDEAHVRADLMAIWEVMKQCIYKGCHTDGILPGGLEVARRAAALSRKLRVNKPYHATTDWIRQIRPVAFGPGRGRTLSATRCWPGLTRSSITTTGAASSIFSYAAA